jgi:hypothetical protein
MPGKQDPTTGVNHGQLRIIKAPTLELHYVKVIEYIMLSLLKTYNGRPFRRDQVTHYIAFNP